MLAHVLSAQFHRCMADIVREVGDLRDADERGHDHDLDRARLRHHSEEGAHEFLRLLRGLVHLPVGGDDGLAVMNHEEVFRDEG